MGMLTGSTVPATPVFSESLAVPNGGVLVALPALVENGLFHEVGEHLRAPSGYYGLPQLVLSLAMLILTRVLSLERLREQPCGEWGRLLGLDRIPEVRTFRSKIDQMVTPEGVSAWAESLGQRWMASDPDLAGVLYVDGHVRAYHGDQTRMPERFSSRDRLCVRSLMDYWICDRDGKPFFVVTALGTEGMIHHLRTTIIPRLLDEVPRQPSEVALAADLDLHRFIIVFDREGYSPALFQELWTKHRIGCLTYRKGTYEPWDHHRFSRHTVSLPFAHQVEMDLAESCDTTIAGVRLREVRKLCKNRQHQTAIIGICPKFPMPIIAGHMFSRWSQENFLNFAANDLAIDRLAGYLPQPAPDQAEVRNPLYRQLDQQLRRLRVDRTNLRAKHGRDLILGNDPEEIAAYLTRSAEFKQQLDAIQTRIDDLNKKLRETPRRVSISSLPEADRPRLISPDRQRFMTTLKIIAYRAETAVCSLLRQFITRDDEARTLVKAIWNQPADLIPDYHNKTLTIRLHHFPSPQISRVVEKLLSTLNQINHTYPGTDLSVRYGMVSAVIPGDPGP